MGASASSAFAKMVSRSIWPHGHDDDTLFTLGLAKMTFMIILNIWLFALRPFKLGFIAAAAVVSASIWYGFDSFAALRAETRQQQKASRLSVHPRDKK